MYGLAFAGASFIGHKIYGACTGSTDKIGEHGFVADALTTDGTSNTLEKMRGCWIRLTTEEVKNNRGFSSLFSQTGETRKANSCRYFINHGNSTTKGVPSADSKRNLLDRAEKAVQFSRQAEHLFCNIAKAEEPTQENLSTKQNLWDLKIYSEDLMYLYAHRDELRAKAIAEKSESGPDKINSLCQIQEQINIINARIQKTEAAFKRTLNWQLKSDKHSPDGYNELLEQFQLAEGVEGNQGNNKYKIEDFIRFYAFKVRLMTDQTGDFYKEVKNDFRQYIFCTSVGHLDASDKLGHKYGDWIKDLLDRSSLGNVDSQSGNISRYFLQTVHNLLNVGKPNFSLAELCIGKDPQPTYEDPQARPVGTQQFAPGLKACSGSYHVNEQGEKIVQDIVAYYRELSKIEVIKKSGDGTETLLPDLDAQANASMKKTLLWNLLGGTIGRPFNTSKKGMFFRIDEQLRNFTCKTEYEMHSKLDGFDNQAGFFEDTQLETFVKKLPANPYLSNSDATHPFAYTYAKPEGANNKYNRHLNVLQSIAHRCQLNDIANPDPNRRDAAKTAQLVRLRENYNQLIADAYNNQDGLNPNLEPFANYLKSSLGTDNFNRFMAIEVPQRPPIDNPINPRMENAANEPNVNPPNQPNEFNAALTSWTAVSDNVAVDCMNLSIRHKETLSAQRFNIVLTTDSDINAHLNIYQSTVDKQRDKLKRSDLCNDFREIIKGLVQIENLITFYKNIKAGKEVAKEIGLVATPNELNKLTRLAVLETEKEVQRLLERYELLNKKYGGTNEIKSAQAAFEIHESEVFEWSLLKTLFEFIDNPTLKLENSNSAENENVGAHAQSKLKNLNGEQVEKLTDKIISDAVATCITKLNSNHYLTLATDHINALNSKRMLQQLVKQKDMLIDFAKVFSSASLNTAENNLDNFAADMMNVIADLEIQYNALAVTSDNKVGYQQFNKLCTDLNSWLLNIFINKEKKHIPNSYRYAGLQHYTLTVPPNIAKTCQENYFQLQHTDFSSNTWSKVSQVHKTLLKSSLASDSSILSQLKLYLGQLFGDGFSYNPETESVPQFQRLLANYESAVLDNLEAMNAIGYLNQEQLGHYDNLIAGVKELGAINTTVVLGSKLLMELWRYTADSNPEKKFECALSDDDKKLYLKTLFESDLYLNKRNSNNIPARKLHDNGDPDVSDFDAHAPDKFTDPAQVISQLLSVLNKTDNHTVLPLNTPLHDYATNTAQKIEAINRKADELSEVLEENKESLKQLLKLINEVRDKLQYAGQLEVVKGTVTECNDLIEYFKVQRNAVVEQTIDKTKEITDKAMQVINRPVINAKKVTMVNLANLYQELYFNLTQQLGHEKINTDEFKLAYDAIVNVALHDEIALFGDEPMYLGSYDEGKDGALVNEITTNIKKRLKVDSLSAINKPLDSDALKFIYNQCTKNFEGKEELIRRYLNAFQYKKIEQCFAKFYIAAIENIPKLDTKLNDLYKLAGHQTSKMPIFEESAFDTRKMEEFINSSDAYLSGVANSIVEWQSLLLENPKYAWLIQSQSDQQVKLQQDYRRYFEWFASTHVKFKLMSLGATGSFRDELQFLIIFDYLKAFKIGDNAITALEKEKIRRFYHAPDNATELQKKEISEILGKINTLLELELNPNNSAMNQFISTVIIQAKNIWSGLLNWLNVKRNESIDVIKYELRSLYELYYLDVVAKANDMLRSINNTFLELENTREAFKIICEPGNEFSKIIGQAEKITTADAMFNFFRHHATKFDNVSSDVLSLFIERIKEQIKAAIESKKSKEEELASKQKSTTKVIDEKPVFSVEEHIKYVDVTFIRAHLRKRVFVTYGDNDDTYAELLLKAAKTEADSRPRPIEIKFV